MRNYVTINEKMIFYNLLLLLFCYCIIRYEVFLLIKITLIALRLRVIQ